MAVDCNVLVLVRSREAECCREVAAVCSDAHTRTSRYGARYGCVHVSACAHMTISSRCGPPGNYAESDLICFLRIHILSGSLDRVTVLAFFKS